MTTAEIFETNSVTIEGPDCSGKTTLYHGIHRATNFKWNIQDRSFLSMICYSRLRERDTAQHRRGLLRELTNLNNRVIVMLPAKRVLLRRLAERGDDFQDRESLVALHSIFAEETNKIRDVPNVLVIEDEISREDAVLRAVSWIEKLEQSDVSDVGHAVRDFVAASTGNETLDVFLQFSPADDFSDVLKHPREGDYYRTIMSDTFRIISSEINGINLSCLKQDVDSRRFYYSSSACLSSIHFLIKNECLHCLAVLRSTDVDRNASIDLKFLCCLTASTAKHFNWPVDKLCLSVRFNSAHIRKDLPVRSKDADIE